MTAETKPSQITPKQARAARLAEQLRTNLAKRKSQMRERKAGNMQLPNDDSGPVKD